MVLPSSPLASVLAVEDDVIVREVIAAYLRDEGYQVTEVGSAAAALRSLRYSTADLLLVDLHLPDLSGFDLVRQALQIRQVAVIYLTSSQSQEDRIHGLESGGDDFLNKPVDPRELLARVRAVLRRYQQGKALAAQRNTLIEHRGWLIDLVRREIADPAGTVLGLTRGEFDLLAALAQNDIMPLSREYLMEVVGSHDAAGNPRMIDVMVSKIRHKLDAAAQPAPQILTVKGLGYRFQPPQG